MKKPSDIRITAYVDPIARCHFVVHSSYSFKTKEYDEPIIKHWTVNNLKSVNWREDEYGCNYVYFANEHEETAFLEKYKDNIKMYDDYFSIMKMANINIRLSVPTI